MNTTPVNQRSPKSRKQALTWVIAGVSAGAIIIAAALIFGTQDSPEINDAGGTPSTPTNTPLPPPDPAEPAPATEEGQIEETEAQAVVEHILAVPLVTVETSEQLATMLDPVATGNYLAELENHWQELAANGWTLEGTPTVISSEVTSLTEHRAEVAACIDSSAVRTLDANGDPIGDVAAPAAMHHFALEQDDAGHWRIASHSFPNDPSCS